MLDLLTAVMDSRTTWAIAAGSSRAGVVWRDSATSMMRAAPQYRPYLAIVEAAAAGASLDGGAIERLLRAWPRMRRWPDAMALERVTWPYAFVTNCSRLLADVAVRRSRLAPEFVLTAEEAGWFKPAAAIYREACRRIGSEPSRTAFVAGSTYDAMGARDAGLMPWLVDRDHSQAGASGIEVVESLEEVVARLVPPPSV